MTLTRAPEQVAQPRAGSSFYRWGLLLAVLTLGLGAYLSLGVGVVHIPLSAMFSPDEAQWEIISRSRVPRMAAILLAGSSMAVAGLVMQRITQNRFVSPSTSGTTEAAILGILLATLFVPGASLTTKMMIAIVTSIIGSVIFLQILQQMRHRDPLVVALLGIMYGSVISAITVAVGYRLDLVQLLDIWTTGSFASIMSGQYEPLYIVLFALIAGFFFADRFTVVGMGRDVSTSLGVNYTFVLYTGLIVISIMSASVVVVVGAIPFLGLIVPNVVALMMGDHVRRVLPVTAVAGAGFVLICDIIGRWIIAPYEIPVATIAGVVGAGFFVWLIVRHGKGASA